VFVIVISVTLGMVGVLASIAAFKALVGGQATEAATLSRVASYILWTQPFVYVAAGLLAGAGDTRWGPVRAPIIGLFLASLCWSLLRRQELLASDSGIVGYLFTAGALFALFGALVAPLIREHVGSVVTGIVVLGVVALVCAYLNLGAISGPVTREVIERAQGMTMSMRTTPVANAQVALIDVQGARTLYTTVTNHSGRYHITHLPLGEYTLRVWDPAGPAVMSQQVTVERAITGGTCWEAVALPTMTRESGRLFE